MPRDPNSPAFSVGVYQALVAIVLIVAYYCWSCAGARRETPTRYPTGIELLPTPEK